MIATLRGTIASRAGAELVIEVSGIGYLVLVPERTAATLALGETLLVHTAMIVRDDHVALFGFDTSEELGIFGLLRGVGGVGPKSAMAILSQMSIDEISDAVVSENDGAFRAVSGIGPKTAKLIVLSLQGSFDERAPRVTPTTASSIEEAVRHSVVGALTGLGWPEKVAKDGVAGALADLGGAPVDAADLLRSALTILGPPTNREVRS